MTQLNDGMGDVRNILQRSWFPAGNALVLEVSYVWVVDRKQIYYDFARSGLV